MDVELIFGKGFKSSDFNDDALVRTLDKIHAAEAKKVFCHASLNFVGQAASTYYQTVKVGL